MQRECLFILPGSVTYFFPMLDQLSLPDYTPSSQDILRARGKTTGVTETVFPNRDFVYNLIDVGGQRSERKKVSTDRLFAA